MRGLDKMQARFPGCNIVNYLSQKLKSEKVVRVLEVGFGEGRCLIDLQARFPNVFFYGINHKKSETMSSSKDIIKHSKEIKVNLKKAPRVQFYDAGKGLKFPEKYFDLVISQVSIHYVGNKSKLYEDVWRVLKKNGTALLHVDSELNKNYPDFMFNYKDTPRMVIYDHDAQISTQKYLKKFKFKGFDIVLKKSHNKTYKKKNQKIIIMKKNTSKRLNLGLNYDGNSTLNLTKLWASDEYKTDSGVWWGTRSVFIAKK
jgi:ubiquinone/menaquinone biosynthesis C-methylase UbiE